ncbi:MAG: hypothetical protein JWR19_2941 [Pedosphaera sp.]|nr:hypothetical protein [Pedosphaera sp.]
MYVSTQGSDSNSGTSAQPFRTITHAYSLAGPGTTILVAPGVYTDHTSGWGLHLGASGTASSPIVLRSQVRGGAVIDGQNASDRNEGIYLDGSYNVVDGFEIKNGPNGGIAIYGNGNQIINNEIHNNGNPASTSTNGKDGVYSDPGTSGNSYASNYIHDNGRSGSNLDHGLYLCGKNELIINNVLVRNAATGLQVAGYTTVSNMRVYNNVIAWNGTAGIILWQSLSGVSIENNVVYQNGHYGLGSYAASGSGVVVDHNLVLGNGSGSYDFTGGGSTYAYTLGTSISADPHFVNETASGFDAHLGAGSPAIGAGLNLSSVFTTDKDGTARPASGAWDLGAYKYGVTDTTPPTVSLSAPANNVTVSGSAVLVSANASDNVSVTSVQFKLDGTNLGSAFTAAPYAKTWDSTTVANGSHTLTAVASDAAGNNTTATPVTITVSNTVATPLPTVTIALTAPNASRVGPVSGAFTITRTGSTASALTVNYSLGGTAINGSDYNTLGTSATIPTGAASATITLVPKPSTNYVGTETAVLTLSANSAYTVGSANSATVNIAGNAVPTTIDKVPSNDVKITWSSVVGKVYSVVSKVSLSDTTWTNLSGLITATNTTTSYTDTTGSKPKTRYYTVYVTD